MYEVDEKDRVTPLEALPQSSVGAPQPFVIADEHRLVLAYYLEEPSPEQDGLDARIVDPLINKDPIAILRFNGCLADAYHVLSTFGGLFGDGGALDFKNSMKGQAPLELLGNAGNFSYYAIGSGYIGRGILDMGAGYYGIKHAFTPGSFVHFSDLTMPYGQDASAKLQENPGLTANGCGVNSNYVH